MYRQKKNILKLVITFCFSILTLFRFLPSDHDVLLRRFCVHDDEKIRRRDQNVFKHSSLHSANKRTLPGINDIFVKSFERPLERKSCIYLNYDFFK